MKTFMKTRKEWIDTLPEDIRERAYNNMLSYVLRNETHLEPTLKEAISGAFIWSGTPEGRDFWDLVAMGRFDKARGLLPRERGSSRSRNNTPNQESAEQIFDRVASNTMVNYDPNGFRANFTTLFKTIILAINEARNQ